MINITMRALPKGPGQMMRWLGSIVSQKTIEGTIITIVTMEKKAVKFFHLRSGRWGVLFRKKDQKQKEILKDDYIPIASGIKVNVKVVVETIDRIQKMSKDFFVSLHIRFYPKKNDFVLGVDCPFLQSKMQPKNIDDITRFFIFVAMNF